MKKGKRNPDRYEMPGGARIEDKTKQRGSRTPSRTHQKAKSTHSNSEKRFKDSHTRSSSGPDHTERSQKTGKQSRAHKPRPTSVIGPS
jgi:hypothetical protein